ncbi:natural resistance-associated macrophage protein-domain-containing protein [Fimicolochytrium jonesii]|uniref:natural resistance-associated macrophage protein-domain-containing protein n=1 Tax=Fimicolochytrium jonesii TaxID=1396493 RepID=UPI0022FF32CC|nr:natural resistance-associated macrophage protein-domain-containing protein [Fimicolochytrium jonesii]KAI8817981.1 natural resistance-associated macrophage protein-domain-containing protein [Fimicolochytrium jonesii]
MKPASPTSTTSDPPSLSAAAAGASTTPVEDDSIQPPSTVVSIDTNTTRPQSARRTRRGTAFSWKTFAKFIGPGYMVAIGYLDPGNWATDLAAGSEYGYSLLYIILTANIMAVLLQYLCIKLGVVTGRDLAQACRRNFHPALNIALYLLSECAIVATDIAEVIGTAIALKLLFGIPLSAGVVLTSLDVLVILAGWNVKHLKVFEMAIIGLMAVAGLCFAILLGKSHPDWKEVGEGFVPTLGVLKDKDQLYIALGIIGATIMPHNLFLHSSIVKYRASSTTTHLGDIQDFAEIESDEEDESLLPPPPVANKPRIDEILKMSNLDSMIALTFALAINAAILIVSAANFRDLKVAELEDAYYLLQQILGWSAGTLFAVALLFAGQSSTITGTMAGQIVMEGFLGSDFRMKPWLRRLVTRVLAIAPSLLAAVFKGDEGVNSLLVFSQVVLSIQLPFAVWPLVYFTSRQKIMTITCKTDPDSTTPTPTETAPLLPQTQTSTVSFANSTITTVVAGIIATLISAFNVVLVVQVVAG